MATDGRVASGTELVERPADERAPVLRLEHVTVRFGGITALDDVGLDLHAGEVCGLIGPNGAGKTTLFDVISGVRPPDAGRVVLNGRDITGWSAVRRGRAGLRRTFQRVQTFGWLSSADNVLAGIEWHGGGGGLLADLVASPTRKRIERERRDQVGRVLEFCGVEGVRDEPAGSLPIGTARMVEVARAIVERPRVLLLDEPTSGLEDAEIERLGDRIRAVRSDDSCAVLLVEHDVGFVMGLCDRVVVLELGRVLATGQPEEIQSNAEVRAAYLGES